MPSLALSIPDTRGGRTYRRILLVAALCAVVGIADAARALFWSGLPVIAGGSPELSLGDALSVALRLAGWGLIGWAAWRGVTRKLLPPTWVALALPVLVWITILT
jgi:hypothetical protein